MNLGLKIERSHVFAFYKFQVTFQNEMFAIQKHACFSKAVCHLISFLIPTDPRFPSHHLFEQRSPPPPPPPPLLNSPHPVPTQSPMPFSQPGPAFSQQGQQPVFPRERPLRPNIQPQGPVGILHFNQPGSANPRPFIPPRQQFLQAPGQPFLTAHAQPNMQVQICSGVGVVKELFQVTQYCVVPMLLYRSNAAKTKLYEVTDTRQIYNIVLCLKK